MGKTCIQHVNTRKITHTYIEKFVKPLSKTYVFAQSSFDLMDLSLGTTLIKAIINGREAYGADINPVSVLISRAKITPIEPLFLQQHAFSLLAKIKSGIANRHGRMLLVTDNFDSTTGFQRNR